MLWTQNAWRRGQPRGRVSCPNGHVLTRTRRDSVRVAARTTPRRAGGGRPECNRCGNQFYRRMRRSGATDTSCLAGTAGGV
jgi:hypothetical protein